eukprot:SAG11_NODE_14300_length_617_cov_3.295367_1_plen_104_part_00
MPAHPLARLMTEYTNESAPAAPAPAGGGQQRVQVLCRDLGIEASNLLDEATVEATFLCDDGSAYAGDDYMLNIGWVWNEWAQRWIDRDNLPCTSAEFEQYTGQ